MTLSVMNQVKLRGFSTGSFFRGEFLNQRTLKKPDGRNLHLFSRRPIADIIVATNPTHDPVIGTSHLRWHPLRGEWVAYASHRQNRTFLPPAEYSPLAVTKSMDFPTELPAGDYDMAVFENLFPSLSMAAELAPSEITKTAPGRGVCEVVVFSQDPNTSLGKMSIEEIDLLLEVLGHRTKEIGARPEIKYVMPFENRGVEVGVTLHHPHGQIYAYPFLPPVQQRMFDTQADHLKKTGQNMLETLIADEIKDGRRVITRWNQVPA